MSDTASKTVTAPESANVEPLLQPVSAAESSAELVEADLLVEDVSIDGMCGVY